MTTNFATKYLATIAIAFLASVGAAALIGPALASTKWTLIGKDWVSRMGETPVQLMCHYEGRTDSGRTIVVSILYVDKVGLGSCPSSPYTRD